jgi:nitric oxide reductase activation protein
VAAKKIDHIFFLFLLLSFLSATPGYGQGHAARPQTADGSVAPTEADERRDQITRDMAKKANIERQAALKNDTERLVKLADELKEYVDKSNENVLSLDVMKKAEEIEKLARSVKEKMKGAN